MRLSRSVRRRLKSAGVGVALVALFGGVGALVVNAVTPDAPPPVSQKVADYYEADKTLPLAQGVSFSVIGDSVTLGNSPDLPALRVGDGSWVKYARSEEFPFEGGWAKKGAQTSEMVQHAAPMKVQVLVIVAGTNDSGNAVPFTESANNLAAIAAKVGAPKVVVSSIPPRDAAPELAASYNAQLKAFAASKGWVFVDGMAGVRAGDRYKPGMTNDGIHPTAAAARIIGETIRTAALKG